MVSFEILYNGKRYTHKAICCGWTIATNSIKETLRQTLGKKVDESEVDVRIYLPNNQQLDVSVDRISNVDKETLNALKEFGKTRASNLWYSLISRSSFRKYLKKDEVGAYFEIDVTGKHYARNCVLTALQRMPTEYALWVTVYCRLLELEKDKVKAVEEFDKLLIAFSIFNQRQSSHMTFQPSRRFHGWNAKKMKHYVARVLDHETGSRRPADQMTSEFFPSDSSSNVLRTEGGMISTIRQNPTQFGEVCYQQFDEAMKLVGSK